MPGLRRLLDWGLTICVALAFVLVFEAEVAKPYRIPSSSMEPTLHCAKPGAWCEGRFNDRVIANRLVYRFESPKRGQIVVFQAPKDACGIGGTFVKRLIGLPGDTVSERDGYVSINGVPLREPYVDREAARHRDQQLARRPRPVLLHGRRPRALVRLAGVGNRAALEPRRAGSVHVLAADQLVLGR